MPNDNATNIESNPGTKIIKGKKVGKGTYGVVYYGVSNSNEKVAVKRNLVDTNTDFIGSLREMDLLIRLKGHPNIVELKNVSFGSPFNNIMSPVREKYCRDDSVHFVFENAECDGLQFIYYRKVTYLQCKVAMMQILLGMEYMHA
ncbi:MAG: protein kinase, partial [Romboutsia sp.]|nr:protein kinase [Romboutsia sp.]